MKTSKPGAPADVILDQREAAIRRIAQRRHRTFKLYAGIMVAANMLIVALWAALALAGRLDIVTVYVWPGQPPLPSGFFWPIFPLGICGVLVLLSARRAYPSTGYPEREIEQEMTRAGTSGPPSGERRAEPAQPATGPRSTDTEMRIPQPRTAESKVRERRRGFWVHVLIYLIVNSVLIVTWVLGGGGFFWPVFLMTAWGAGVVVNAYQAYGPRAD